MPVAGNTQPYGLWHGGASCVLAETLASLGSFMYAQPERVSVGVDINATHHRSVTAGWVTGTATADTPRQDCCQLRDRHRRRCRKTGLHWLASPASSSARAGQPERPNGLTSGWVRGRLRQHFQHVIGFGCRVHESEPEHGPTFHCVGMHKMRPSSARRRDQRRYAASSHPGRSKSTTDSVGSESNLQLRNAADSFRDRTSSRQGLLDCLPCSAFVPCVARLNQNGKPRARRVKCTP